MSRLDLREELAVPSWPAVSISTGRSIGALGCHPTNVGDKAGVSHIRTWHVADTNHAIGCGDIDASGMPKTILLFPAVLLAKASKPMAMLPLPLVLLESA